MRKRFYRQFATTNFDQPPKHEDLQDLCRINIFLLKSNDYNLMQQKYGLLGYQKYKGRQ